MSEPFIGEIRMFASNFAPRGWALCDGQVLSIAMYTALFSLLGTTYGGDGRLTFALPDLRGRVPLHPGLGPGLSSRSLGESGGREAVTLTQAQMPSHTHQLAAAGLPGTSTSPEGAVLAATLPGQAGPYAPPGMPGATALAPQALAHAGGSQPHDTMQPFLAVNFIIALEGIFPPRS